MALFVGLLAVLVGTLLTVGLLPYGFRLLGRLIGGQLRSKTQQRREVLLSRAAEEEKAKPASLGKKSLSTSSSIDEEWEKVGREDPLAGSDGGAQKKSGFEGVVGFFHPFCNAGGGGERVLFAAIQATQHQHPKAQCVVYTGDHDASKEQILTNVHNRFNLDLNAARISFVYLSTREWVHASKWPHFTLLGQSLGSLILSWDAFNLLAPDIFIDTMGYAFTLTLCKWLFPSTPTAAYVHYPTISTDMLSSLHDQVKGRGVNAGLGKGARGKAKQIYWELFAKLYGWVGGHVDVVMTNSTWTQRHISSLWGAARTSRQKRHGISVVYPPCAVEELRQEIPVDEAAEAQRTRNILYIAQFRPEKEHQMIIDAFTLFLKTSAHLFEGGPKPKLILAGSVRDDQDEKRVYKLRLQAQDAKDSIEFVVNAKWSQIMGFLKTSSVGVNGMWNEHFGIGVVEYQAAGLISVVNDSAGPKEDIVVPIDGEPTGFHASTTQQFADCFAKALTLSPKEALAMRQRARQSSKRFSEDVFIEAWNMHMDRLVELASP